MILHTLLLHLRPSMKLKGHRIMVQIQSTWFPLADRNPQKFTDIYNALDSDFQKATIRIYHDTEHASKIVLPVLK